MVTNAELAVKVDELSRRVDALDRSTTVVEHDEAVFNSATGHNPDPEPEDDVLDFADE